jgi:hypothetical protein
MKDLSDKNMENSSAEATKHHGFNQHGGVQQKDLGEFS